MKKAILAILMASLMLVTIFSAISVSADEKGPTPIFASCIFGYVEGFKQDGIGKEKISGALVSCVGIGIPNLNYKSPFVNEERTTDENGFFEFGGARGSSSNWWLPSPGIYFLIVSKDGYLTNFKVIRKTLDEVWVGVSATDITLLRAP